MDGCPVLAYDKDPLTGIVRHLDDQCIGCQYCVFMCPYDVPRYSPSKGIVRKCDMCHDRLAAGEAPACVQSCPNQAIRIRTIAVDTVKNKSDAGVFLPSSPDPRLTLPTTNYRSQQPLAANLMPSDYFTARPQHSHLALVLMLVITQLSVGAFVVGQFLVWGPWTDPLMHTAIRPIYAVVGLILGLIGMNTAIFHLGRPLYAYRALLGLRTSWLSREILAFSAFGMLAMLHATLVCWALYHPAWNTVADWLGFATAASGIIAVICSVMIYVRTHRPFWALPRTGAKFLLSCVVLGLPCALLVSLAASLWETQFHASQIMQDYGQQLCRWIILFTTTKLIVESTIFLHLAQKSQFTPLKRTAILLAGDLGQTTMLRYFFGIIGGLLLPAILLSSRAIAQGQDAFQPLFLIATVIFSFVLLLIGELLERYLYFAASSATKMPGALQS
jgi:DMSO reductase anchor subunit/ferredoxin